MLPGRVVKLRLVVLIACASVCVAESARAEGVSVERGRGAESCPDAAALEARVREETRPSAARDGLSVVVRFEKTRAGYRAALHADGGAVRALSDDGPTCGPLADATALAVRLALDLEPSSSDAGVGSKNEAERTAEPTTVSTEDATSAVRADETLKATSAVRADGVVETTRDALAGATGDGATWSVGFWLLGGAGFAVGMVDSFAPGARASAGVALDSGRWTLGATGALTPPRTIGLGAGEVNVSYAGGGAEVCRRHRFVRAFAAGGCARAEVGLLTGSARGFDRSDSRTRPLVLAGLLARGELRVFGPAALFAEIGALVPVVRERFEIDGVGLVHDPAMIAPSGAVGALLEIE